MASVWGTLAILNFSVACKHVKIPLRLSFVVLYNILSGADGTAWHCYAVLVFSQQGSDYDVVSYITKEGLT